jgi:hypothetical protein
LLLKLSALLFLHVWIASEKDSGSLRDQEVNQNNHITAATTATTNESASSKLEETITDTYSHTQLTIHTPHGQRIANDAGA